MAGVRKKPFTSGLYQGWYRNSQGQRVYFKGSTSKADTRADAEAMEVEARKVKNGVVPARSSADKAKTLPVSEAVALYTGWGKTQGGHGGRPWSAGHARMRKTHLAWWQKQLGLSTLADLPGILPRVEHAFQELQAAKKAGKTLANYADAIRAFCLWLKERGMLAANPLESMAGFDVTPKTERRAAGPGEVQRLLDNCSPHRRLVYEVAFCSGLRANELRSLRVSSLNPVRGGLDLDAAWTKNRRPGFQPLPESLCERLAQYGQEGHAARLYRELPNAWKRKALPQDPLLYVPSHPARDLEKDLIAAGIPKHLDGAKLDFHALRVSYCTAIIESGANVKEAQALMRHSTAEQTMRAYAKARQSNLAGLAEAVGASILPAVREQAAEALKTGTDDRPVCAGTVEKCATGVLAGKAVRITPGSKNTCGFKDAGSIPAASTISPQKQSVNSGDTQAVQSLHSPYENGLSAPPQKTDGADIYGTLPKHNKNTVSAEFCAVGVLEIEPLTVASLTDSVKNCAALPAHIRAAVLALLATVPGNRDSSHAIERTPTKPTGDTNR